MAVEKKSVKNFLKKNFFEKNLRKFFFAIRRKRKMKNEKQKNKNFFENGKKPQKWTPKKFFLFEIL